MAIRQSTTEDTQTAKATKRSHVRDDAQQEIDGFVAALVQEWQDAGQPADNGPTRRFDVDDRADGKRRVNRAFSLVSKQRREAKTDGKATPALPATLQPDWYKDSEPDAEGWVTIKFGVEVAPTQPTFNGQTPPAEVPAEDDSEQKGRRNRS